MNRLQRAAVLTELADKMRQQGSWCGETHLQKATYFLQVLLQVPSDYDFIFYKFGPFSFDLRDELTALQADGLMGLQVRGIPYGPSLWPTERSTGFRQRYPVTLGKYGDAIDFVARTLGQKGVADLERLATALYVTREGDPTATVEQRARHLNELKPHVPFAQAEEAIRECDEIIRQSATLQPE